MARSLNPKQLTSLGAGQHSDGGGLYFVETPTGERSWMFRFSWGTSRPEFTFADFPATKLDAARDKATEYRNEVKQGRDPRDLVAAGDREHTFIKVARQYIPDWCEGKYDRAVNEWERMLDAVPTLHGIPVAIMTTENIEDALRPLWKTIPVSASRYLNKIHKVLAISIRKGWRKKANPAEWKNHLSLTFTTPRVMQAKVKAHGLKRKKRVSLPFDDLPDFMQKLAYDPTIAARCVEFAILTGGRSQEAHKAEWTWYDEKRGLFNIPAHVMGKTKEPHTVVLCKEATALLASLPRRSKYIFPSDYNATERDEHVRGHAMLYRVRKIAKVDVHGFRSTFRNYAGAETDASFETAEAAIAHKIGNDTTRAYFDDPVYKKRAKLMAEWGEYACSKRPKTAPTKSSDNVVVLKQRAA